MTYHTEYKEFHELYQQEFTPDPKQELACQLAQEYHDKCEAYDRTVCTGPIRQGSIRPNGYRELAMINEHANKVRKEIYNKAMYQGVPWHDVMMCISRI